MFEFGDIEGKPYLRLMRPMIAKEPCLKCHGHQGYKVGDVRGGVGVSLPVASYIAVERRAIAVQSASHGMIWLIGLAAIALVFRSSRKRTIERLLAADALARKSEELERANAELQQFAFAASHDLQEPLRAVVSQTQFLQHRYEDKLDEEANQIIGHAVAGAKMMRARIADILAYLRVTERTGPLAPVDTHAVVTDAVDGLNDEIVETNAAVMPASLPEVVGDQEQLGRVFRHLIGNALKYRHPDRPPEVRVSAEKRNREWVFSVRDNGIGIEPQYREHIFGVFRRLHTQEEYPGTGMGLAICRKIVERHAGRIWVESTPGEGSTFFFTLPTAGEKR